MNKIEVETLSEYNNVSVNSDKRQEGRQENLYINPDTGKEERISCHNLKHIGDKYKTFVYPDGRILWRQEKDFDKHWTGHYICESCYQKAKKKCRNKLIEKNSNIGKGFRVEMAIAKTLKIDNCNLKLNNFNSGPDLYDPIKHKIIQSRSAQPSVRRAKGCIYDVWHISLQNIEIHKFNTLMVSCMDNANFNNIERMYAFPAEALPLSKDGTLTEGITIYKNPKNPAWYEKYRIDEKYFNEAYHSLKIENCSVIKSE